ncbi:MAG: membrane protein insertion efficiency factor YidD [Herminiimonas sp.]|nr:membrane protein insertion efficiency factor YidD [Herminiimonas sp.]
MLRHAGIALIGAYQRYLSPRKGYRCAYGVLYQDGTCSSVGKNPIRTHGLLGFFRLMPRQFEACKAAAATLQESAEERPARRKGTTDHGECACDLAESGCDAIECGRCGDS